MKKIAGILVCLLCMSGMVGETYANPPAHAGGKGSEKKQKDAARHNAAETRGPAAKGKGPQGGASREAAGGASGELLAATITALTARQIAVGGGWVGYQALPPGIAKNLGRGKPLPPGIARKTLPAGMLQKLPSYPGYTWCAAGKDLVLFSAASMVIADVLHNVFD